MKKFFALILSALLIFSTVLCGCNFDNNEPSPNDPVTLSIWHVYGSQTESPFNDLIEKFNKTTGKEKGIIINITSVTDSSSIDDALISSAKNEPMSAEMPDMFTAYPRVMEELNNISLLDWSEYFSDEELDKLVSDFTVGGTFDDKQLGLPIAKSTELFFLNQTLFNRFAEENNLSDDDLSTYESIFRTCRNYYDWSGGKNMFQINDFYNYFLVNMDSLGSEFIKDNKINFEDDTFYKVYEPMAQAAIHGGLVTGNGYASDRWKTGEVICNVGSTAGILYLKDYITYEDNTKEDIETSVLIYPQFADASKKTVLQRGTDLFAVKSENEKKNKAIAYFAKFIIEEQNNLEFVTASGYLPVTNDAFENIINNNISVDNEKYRLLYSTVSDMYGEYSFVSAPVFDGSAELQSDFENIVKATLSSAHSEYYQLSKDNNTNEETLSKLTEDSFETIKNHFK